MEPSKALEERIPLQQILLSNSYLTTSPPTNKVLKWSVFRLLLLYLASLFLPRQAFSLILFQSFLVLTNRPKSPFPYPNSFLFDLSQMGNCCPQPKRAAAEIAPYDYATKPLPTARLYGSATSSLTAYLRFALLHKNLSPQFVESDSPALQIGSDTVSGCRESLLRFIEAKVPNPPFAVGLEEGRTVSVERVTWLQHRSMRWHVERMVRWAEDLAARGGRKWAGDPVLGTPKMEARKFGQSYSHLLEVMLEHARLEETIVFPILEAADRGICKEANEEHARDLPIMNGIKEDIKSIGVLNSANPSYQEALSSLSTRLKSLQKHCKQHFDAEEGNLLPLVEATELSREQQQKVLEQCFDAMKATHSHLFNFFLEGLLPQEAMEYLDFVKQCDGRQQKVSTVHMILE